MPFTLRPYDHASDYDRVSRFLVEVYDPASPVLANWLQARWEYTNYHPFIRALDRSTWRVAEMGGDTVGIVHNEGRPIETYIQCRPGNPGLKAALLAYAGEHFIGYSQSRSHDATVVYINDFDDELAAIARAAGYEPWEEFTDAHSSMSLAGPLPECPLAEGYRLQSLADENDLSKINRVLHRGFNHDGEPDEADIEGRAFAQSAPNFRRDLTIVAVAPGGDYASFSGNWWLPENRVSMVEPVATDPDHRRKGLATAAILESLRRVKALGAEIAWVGNDLPFYLSMGFEVKYHTTPWGKLR